MAILKGLVPKIGAQLVEWRAIRDETNGSIGSRPAIDRDIWELPLIYMEDNSCFKRYDSDMASSDVISPTRPSPRAAPNSFQSFSNVTVFESPLSSPISAPEGEAEFGNASRMTQKAERPLAGNVSLDVVRSLYLSSDNNPRAYASGRTLRRSNSSVVYHSGPPEFPPVKKLNPLNKKRILVSGVSDSK